MSSELCPNDLQLGMKAVRAMHLAQDHQEDSRKCGDSMYFEDDAGAMKMRHESSLL